MKHTLSLGRIAGIPVGMHWSVLAILILITTILGSVVLPRSGAGAPGALIWIVAVGAALLFLLSLLAHELAHALVALRRGVDVNSITLWMLGGVAELRGEARTARADLLIAAVGPLTSLAVAGFFYLLALGGSAAGLPGLVLAGLTWLALMNAILAVFNMLPGAPLDGGRVLRAALWWRHGDRERADRAAARAGVVLGISLMGLGVLELVFVAGAGGLWLIIIGWFLSGAARAERVQSTLRRAASELRVRDIMTPEPVTAPGWVTVAEFATDLAPRTHQIVFPVVDFDGRTTGYVTLDMIAAVPRERARDIRIADIARELPGDRVVGPDEEAASILDRATPGGDLAAVVAEDGRVAGMVTATDIARMTHLGERLRR